MFLTPIGICSPVTGPISSATLIKYTFGSIISSGFLSMNYDRQHRSLEKAKTVF